MPRVYLDTSIVFRYCTWRYLDDQNVDEHLLELFKRGLNGDFEIVISQLSTFELTGLIKAYPISKSMLNVIIEQMQNSPDLSYVKLDVVSKSFFDEISKYSKYGLSPMDSMHLRIAQDIACNYFVTEDLQILRSSKELELKGLFDTGFKVVSIREILKILNAQRKGVEEPILAGKAFEDLVREHFENMGYNVLVSTSKKDIEPDFIVEKDGKKFAVETKLYLRSPVSRSEIERFLSAKPSDIDAFWIVSPSGFSKSAEKIARERPDEVRLLNTTAFIRKSYPKYKKILRNRLVHFYEPKIEFEIDFAELSKYWEKVKNAKTNKEKKDTLENLADFLFRSIKGIEVIDKNIRTSAEEIDLLLKNESGHIFWSQLGSPLLVECKNWNKKIGTDEVVIFKDKLETQGVKVGILIAVKGITGTKKKDAVLKIREYKQRGFRIVLLTGEDIEDICDGVNPTDKLQEKYYDLFKF